MKDHLAVAKVAQNDEYYTLQEDVEAEIQALPEILQKKWICPCDGENSAFVKCAIKHKIQCNHESKIDIMTMPLRTTQDEIIFTNPPFSLLKYLLPKLEYTKANFCIIIPLTSIGNRTVVRNIKNGKWYLNGSVTQFNTPSGKAVVPCLWLSNISEIRNPYKWSNNIPKKIADNGRMYLCDSIKDITISTDKIQAVPITYLQYHDPCIFKIIGIDGNMKYKGAKKFTRILIRKNTNKEEEKQ